jgi:hypothetical protein
MRKRMPILHLLIKMRKQQRTTRQADRCYNIERIGFRNQEIISSLGLF